MALLTVFNLAVNGFDKEFTYRTDPNTTVKETHWYNNPVFAWGSDSLTPTCQNLQIPIGYQFITTNLGFQYTVSKIFFVSAANRTEERSSMSYHNNTLDKCDVIAIRVRMKKSDWAAPEKKQDSFARFRWMESDASATARCEMANRDGRFILEFRAEYTPQIYQHRFIASDDIKLHAPLWWGARLLNAYFAGIQHTMSGWLPDGNTIYTRANMDFSTKSTERNRSINDPQLYRLQYNFIQSNGKLDWDEGRDSKSIYNNTAFAISRPLTEAFMWNKIFRSVILADLGNTEAENLLTNETLLRYALDPDDDFNRVPGAPLEPAEMGNWRWMFAAMPDPYNNSKQIFLNESFDVFKNKSKSLETKPASIFAEYICSVPGARSPVAMIMFTLVANLALFHSAWALFKYVADRYMSWINKESNWCEGCIDMRRDFEEGKMRISSEALHRSETREGIEMTKRGECCKEGSPLEEGHMQGENGSSEEEYDEDASISMGELLRSESSSTQRLIPG
ncbi:hypothetical protein BCR34DRAFT_582590 [Clohesyomyces aquaticus]|uniref:Uncharacterized protein n=1 Tax=Clohesyomyces aquaticus TaxID=1231657 RepID=A0A1Y2A932_9PLEO|nr:hypothetical protein BCR34DRAFT_582590 [Clohesyomyces aquaticus]